MKIFMGNNLSCYLNYEFHYILEKLSKHFEITDNVSEADILIFAANQYEQLTDEEIEEHTKLYTKVLKSRNVPYKLV